MRMFVVLPIVALSLAIGVRQAHAQTTHAVSDATLDAAVQEHVSQVDADRAAVLRVLDRIETKGIAEAAGVDLRRAKDAVRTLDPEDLSQVAAEARRGESALAGGQSRITISTTMIIIGLLVLILLIVALK